MNGISLTHYKKTIQLNNQNQWKRNKWNLFIFIGTYWISIASLSWPDDHHKIRINSFKFDWDLDIFLFCWIVHSSKIIRKWRVQHIRIMSAGITSLSFKCTHGQYLFNFFYSIKNVVASRVDTIHTFSLHIFNNVYNTRNSQDARETCIHTKYKVANEINTHEKENVHPIVHRFR